MINTPDIDLIRYYERRAPDYEDIYRRPIPEQQTELQMITSAMQAVLAGRRVLEVACGTGYWTERLAQFTQHVTAVDTSPSMLKIAESKKLPNDRVRFLSWDAYKLDKIPGSFDAALINFWVSHISRKYLGEFIRRIHRKAGGSSIVFIADNCFAPELGGVFMDAAVGSDTYRIRRLADGTEWKVLKNYYKRDELYQLFALHSRDLDIRFGKYYWWLSYSIFESE